MKRLTDKDVCITGQRVGKAIYTRLWMIENILGEDYDLDRLLEALQKQAEYIEFMGRWKDTVAIAGAVKEVGSDRMAELVDADKEERAIIAPANIGEIVYHITTCKNFSMVLDGTMYGSNGEPGTATGYYCPCELAENCPFELEEDGTFDCDKHKNTPAIYEDVVTEIVVNDMESFVRLDYSGCVDFEEFGKTVFRTREEAEAALEKIKEKQF